MTVNKRGRSMMDLVDRWRIVDVDAWGREALDLVEPGFIEFAKNRTDQFGFIAVRGWLDCRPSERDGHPFVEFSWEGLEEDAQISGRGWATPTENGTLKRHLFIPLGDDSSFHAAPFSETESRVK